MADDASRLLHLSDLQFLTYSNYHYPQHQSWQIWTPNTIHVFHNDYRLAQEKFQAGVVSSRFNPANSHWDIWSTFCLSLAVDHLLSGILDPIVLLQVFAQRYRTGKIAPRGQPVRFRTVEDAIRSVGQTFSSMGTIDPRLTRQGKINSRNKDRLPLQQQLAAYTKEDPPPN
jgi:hypothetical protein